MSRSSSIDDPPALSRRAVLGGGAALSLLALAPNASAIARERKPAAGAAAVRTRLDEAYDVRVRAAELSRGRKSRSVSANGDETGVPARAACFSKCLPHDASGLVDARAYAALLKALATRERRDLEAVPLGGFVKLANPEAAWAFDLVGPDASQPTIVTPPAFASEEQAAEMVELYWQALARDVAFADYERDPLILRAAEELSRLRGFRGPRDQGAVTPATIFRGASAGDLVGPYVSQFLTQDLWFLPMRVPQRIRTAVPHIDYVTTYPEWLGVQNGKLTEANRFDATPRYIRNARDLGEYVHRDFTFQAFLCACLLALRFGAPPDGANPYKHSRTQSAFVTFGQPYLLSLLAMATQVALKGCWYQKWLVHRRLRPEELGGRIESQLRGRGKYPLHASVLESAALATIRRTTKAALLPQAYPEGCPTHPSYPSGHAVIAGACATMLKALLDESQVIPDPVVATADGLGLVPWKGATLTVGGELDKLAFNMSMGRNFAGIHWRSDAHEGLRFGEEIAVALLEEMRVTGHELFAKWSFRSFDGNTVAVG